MPALRECNSAARVAQALPAPLGVGECKYKVGGDALLAYSRLDILILVGERCPWLLDDP